MVIKILDHVKTASSYEDGQTIHKLISTGIQNNETVVLSFESISSVPSAFINSALLPLLDEFPFEQIKERLLFVDTTKHINDLIKSRFNFVLSNQAKS